jgi:hypothetical protein
MIHWLKNALGWGSLKPFFLGFGVLAFITPVRGWAVWEIEQPEGTAVYGFWTSLVLDSAGYPQLVYNDSPRGGTLRFVGRSATGWARQVVDTGLGVDGGHSSLTMTAAGFPRVSYNKTGVGLQFAKGDGASWTLQTVDPDGGFYSSLKMNSTGTAFISYFSSNNLKCATWNGVAWSTATVDRGGVGLWSSLALNGEGKPLISYYDQTNGDLKLAQWDGVAWSTQTVVSSGDVGKYSSLALDVSGHPQVAFDGGGSLQWARYTGSEWTFETVDLTTSSYISLANDPAGIPVIAYESSPSALKLATRKESGWSIDTVDDASGRYASLAIGRDGSSHISYGSVFLSYAKNEVLKIPTGIRVFSRTSNSLVWAWDDASTGETGYRILRASDLSSLSTDLPANTVQWTQTGLTPNTSAQILVRAFNGSGFRDSLPSPIHSSLSVPPTNLHVASIFGSSAILSWSDNGNSPETNYHMEKSTDGVSFFNVWIGTASSAIATQLNDGATTYFRVRSKNNEDYFTDYDDPVPVFILPTSPPKPPKHLLAKERTTTSITWGWKDESQWETVLRVLRPTDLVPLSTDLPADSEEWIQTDLTPNTSAQIVVRASNTYGSSDSLASSVRYSLAESPTSLAIDSYFGTSATVSWSAHGNPLGTNYRLETSPDSIFFGLVAVTTQTWAEVSGLIAGTTNYFRVRAENHDGIATVYASTSSVYLPPVTPPTPPGTPEVKQRTSSSITWSWLDNSSTETTFRVFRPNALVPLSAPLPLNTVEWTETGLTPNTSSQIVVRAENDWGHNDSLDSPVRYSFAVPPSAVTVTVSSATAAHVMWAANGNPGSTRYRLETSADGRTFSLVMIGTNTETVAEELIDGATNYFRVRAENGDGVTTVYSSTASVFLPFAIPPTRPGAPFVTHQSSSTLTWGWADRVNETGYVVLHATALLPLSGSLSAGAREWIQTGLSPNRSSQIIVRAVNPFGFTDSAVSPVRYSLAVPPESPEVSITGGAARVSWDGRGNSPQTHYHLGKSFDGISYMGVTSTTATFVEISDLLDGTTIYFKLRAENGNGISTEDISFNVFAPPLSVPDTPGVPLVKDRTSNEIHWAWSDKSHNESGFRVIRDSDSALLATLPANTTSWIQAGLSPNSFARVQVEVLNSLGAVRTQRNYRAGEEYTLAAAPLATRVSAVTPTSLTVQWDAGENPSGTLYQGFISTDSVTFRPSLDPADQRSLTLGGLTSGVTYYVRVDSLNGGQALSPGPVVNAPIPFGPPPSPVFQRADVDRTPSTLRWKWASVPNAQGYRIVRPSDGENLSGNLSADTLEWVHQGLAPNQEMVIQLEAYNTYGSSSILAAVTTPPLPPANVHVDRLVPLQLTLKWENNGNASGTQFLPEISTDNIHFEMFPDYLSGFTSTIANLEENTTYYLRVQTLPVDPEFPVAQSLVIVTRPLETVPPPPPRQTRIVGVYRSSVSLVWQGAETLFETEISTDNVNFNLVQPARLGLAATVENLEPDTTYFFRVRAINLERKKSSPYDVAVSTFLQALPYPPTALAPLRSPGALTWRWKEVSNALGYRILRADDKTALSEDLPVGTSSWVQSDIGPSQRVSVDIESFNSYGIAARSVSTLSLPNPPVQTKVVEVTPSLIRISWEENWNIEGTRYLVEVSTEADVFRHVPLVTQDRSLSIKNPLVGTPYFFRVRARNDDLDGYSAYDVVVSTKFQVERPISLIATNTNAPNEMTWVWTSRLEGTSGFRVIRVGDGKDLSGLLPGSDRSWTQKGLLPNTPYQTFVRAEGTFGNEDSLPGPVVHTLPNGPRGTRLTGRSYGKVSLAWNTNGNPEWTTYAVYFSSGLWDPQISTRVVGGMATVDLLAPQTSYVFSVRAVGPGGASLPDQSISVTTTGDPIQFDLANPDWLITTVDAQPGAGEYATMELDSLGAPKILYQAGTNLMLAQLGKRGWARDALVSDAHVGAPVSLMIDGTDHTQLVYFNRRDRTLNYLSEGEGNGSPQLIPTDTMSGSGWSFSFLGQGFQGVTLKRTSGGVPVIAYTSKFTASETGGRMDQGTYLVYEARRTETTWVKNLTHSFPIGESEGAGTVRLALDSKGNSHLLYFHSTGPATSLYYAYQDGGTWVKEPVELGVAGMITSLAIEMGADDSPHIFYSDTENQKVRFGVRGKGGWTLETVEGGKSFAFVNLALDGRGKPHVVYTDFDSGVLRYGNHNGETWAVQTVEDKGKTGWFPSIKVDGENNVHLAYYDFTNKVLKYAALVSRRLVAEGKVLREGGQLEFWGSRGTIGINVPAGAFQQDVTFAVKSPELMVMPIAQKRDLTPLGIGLEISVSPVLKAIRPITLTFPYAESDMLPGHHEDRLTLARYDEAAGEWVPVPTQVDSENNRLIAIINEMTVYQVMWMGVSSSVSEAKAYPNPFRPNRPGHDKITFDDIPTGAQIKIYTLTGGLVQELSEDGTGRAKWDGRNGNGESVASGIYFVRIGGDGGDKVIKVAVQR